MTGFEPAASASQTQHSDQTELHPEIGAVGLEPTRSKTSGF